MFGQNYFSQQIIIFFP